MDGMTDTELPNSDSVVLYVKPNQLLDDQSGRKVEGFAFVWNGRGEGLSVNWLEYFGCLSKAQQIERVRELIHRSMSRSGGLAELNVGTVLERISDRLDEPRFVHRPSPPSPPRYPKGDPTHCELKGLPEPDDRVFAAEIGDMIAECVSEIHPTRASSGG